ncbi:Intraflagellar transport protein 81 -like protein [Halotydeus destructor]|nr:Intraflagellar transport protein 81 -like protein [Halotydeus destructor]
MDDIKFVVKELNEKLGKKLNLISYDNLRGEQRLEVLVQVFKQIDPTITVESFEVADAEEVVVRILEMLRIFKYKPMEDIDPSTFRQGIIIGDKAVLTHVMAYLLSRLDELKKRAYLARFLVKIEVSPDLEGDNDIVVLYQQYEQLIDSFKVMHTSKENLSKSTKSVVEIQRDIQAMEQEKEQVYHKLSNTKRKVDASTNPTLFQLVTLYCEETERNAKMTQQSDQQQLELEQTKQRVGRVENHLADVRLSFQVGSGPSNVMDKLRDEIAAKKHLVKEILPKELASVETYLAYVQDMDGQASPVGPEYLDKINQRMQLINKEINVIMEKKMIREDPMDDKLALFRQNAANVAKKKDALKGKLEERQVALDRMREMVNDKRSAFDGQQILKGDALKQFVQDIRNKGNVYKRKKTELSELRTENSIKLRTVETLQAKEKSMMLFLTTKEEERGIAGYFSLQEQARQSSSDRDRRSALPVVGDTHEPIDQLTMVIKQLNTDITDKKAKLAPVIKDLRPLRQQHQDLQYDHDQKKATYDATAAGLEGTLGKLDTEVKKLHAEASKLQSAEFKLQCETEQFTAYASLLEQEMKYFVSSDDEHKGHSLQERIKKELLDQQQEGEVLKSKQKHFRDNEVAAKRQAKLWRDLQTIMEMKKVCLQKTMQANSASKSGEKQDHLIL